MATPAGEPRDDVFRRTTLTVSTLLLWLFGFFVVAIVSRYGKAMHSGLGDLIMIASYAAGVCQFVMLGPIRQWVDRYMDVSRSPRP